MNARYDLKQIMDIDKWHKLQDSMSLVTKMAIITVDYKGVPVSKHSECQAFCREVRKDSTLSSYCQKCDARGGLEAVRSNKPYIYQCHFQILDIAIPIVVDDQYIGAVMAGQIKLSDPDVPIEQIVTRPPNVETDKKFHALREEYQSLPVLSFEEVEKIADMLYHLCNYIVEEAIRKSDMLQMYRDSLSLEHPAAAPIQTIDSSYEHIQALQSELSSTLIGKKLKKSSSVYQAGNSLLQPAFDYIYRHKHENADLKEMAAICHVSPSYFSRIFTKETGENFSVFVPHLKIGWAKELLETTELSVAQIGDELGFADAGYFIKTFKKFESLTPAAYRKIYRDKA
ncbi:PocR ligand-binding domain-containing protein [Paenibacillus glycanilyticus]|uniref:PocR ligand-binding domain-containing protein n=1 Tax=Paenibacillus glycanilyticus TaxID=126569 RepID=UPI00203A402F|nr:PocR ligand-binding domain-containing protein [Paenibacillus glycanilyticus]MCM3629457.1 PocR ligand-binding domain-containing protein [Paenibacillus glycanilyticus]